MLCENCHKRDAAVHFTQIINSKKVGIYLCDQCAKEKKYYTVTSPLSLDDFFSGLMGFAGSNAYINNMQQETVCSKCGMSYGDFKRASKMGCENCYEVFGEKLEPLVRRIHGSLNHTGKIPEKVSKCIKVTKEIDRLKQELEEAIKNEEYEKAAEIRDRIKSVDSMNK